MNFQLSKSQKRIARQLIDKGLLIEYAAGLIKVENLLKKWRSGDLDNRNAYHEVYKAIKYHDKHIARRYDYVSGSKYLLVIAGQLADNVLSLEDIEEFNEDIREKLMLMSGIDADANKDH